MGVRNHGNGDVITGELDTDQLIAVADQQRRWYNGSSAGNCADGRTKRRRVETGYLNADSDVSAGWRKSRDECPEISVPEKADVVDGHHQVAHALHLASTVILGVLVVEVRITHASIFILLCPHP